MLEMSEYVRIFLVMMFRVLIILLFLASTIGALQSFKHVSFLPSANRFRAVLMKRKALIIPVDSMDMYQGISEAFVGGTVGVMSVMFMLEVKKKEDLAWSVAHIVWGMEKYYVHRAVGVVRWLIILVLFVVASAWSHV